MRAKRQLSLLLFTCFSFTKSLLIVTNIFCAEFYSVVLVFFHNHSFSSIIPASLHFFLWKTLCNRIFCAPCSLTKCLLLFPVFIVCLKWPSVSYAWLVFCSLALVTLLYWSLEIMAHNTLTWFTKYLSDLIWVVWGWGWRHSCHSSTSHKSFPRMVVRGLQGKGKFCHYHINGELSHFLFLKLHSSETSNRNLWWQIMSECKRRVSKRRESPDFRFPEVGISDGGKYDGWCYGKK